MSLATRCPACGTVFRVVQDQLRVSQGWVRCGRCSEAFNALESMVELRPAPPVAAPLAGQAMPLAPRELAVNPPVPAAPDTPPHTEGAAAPPVPAMEPGAPAEHVAAAAVPDVAAQASEAPVAAPPPHDQAQGAGAEVTVHVVPPASDERLEPAFGFDDATAPLVDPTPFASSAPGVDPSLAGEEKESEAEPHGAAQADAHASPDPRAAPVSMAAPVAPPDDPDARLHAAQAAVAAPVDSVPGVGAVDAVFAAPAATVVDLDVNLNDTPLARVSAPTVDTAAQPEPAPLPQPQAAAGTHDARSLEAGTSPVDQDDAPLSTLQAPSFIRKADQAERWRRPGVRRALAVCAVTAALALTAQVIHAFRDRIAAGSPALRPVLQQACATLGCRVGEYRQIDALSVESSGLVKVEGAPVYRLSVTLRNRAAIDVAAPALDLALTDAQGKPIARRVLQMSDLNLPLRSLKAGSELPIQVPLGIGERPVSGYTVEIFYP